MIIHIFKFYHWRTLCHKCLCESLPSAVFTITNLSKNVVTYTGELGIQNVLGIHEWYPWLLCKALRIFLSDHYVQQQFFHCCFPCILNIKSLIGLQNVGFKKNIKGKVFSPTSRQPPLRNPSQEIFENFEATSFRATAGRFRW